MEKFNILEEKGNPVFDRKEVKFSIEAKITPSNSDVQQFLAEKFSAPADAVRIKNIFGSFGSKVFTISANVYKSKEEKDAIEPKSKKKSEEKEEEPEEKSEEKSEEKVEEKSVEEKKEEKTAEEKPEEVEQSKDSSEDNTKSQDKTQDSTGQQDSELKSNEKMNKNA